MQPPVNDRELHVSGVMSKVAFGISQNDHSHILTILRDTLYQNKVLAVLREYSSNAWDSHREAGIGDRPIKVMLPTELESSVTIRDFGGGLSEDDVYKIYTQYGASSKRGSNTSVGMLGIGSKSGFAYNDSFTITSFHEGIRKVYHAVLDPSNIGLVMKVSEAASASSINLFLEERTLNYLLEERFPKDQEYIELSELEPDEEKSFRGWIKNNLLGTETGVEIKIPVVPSDIPSFMKEARRLYPYFNPLPETNISLKEMASETPSWSGESGYLTAQRNPLEARWVAVMGCVPYRLNLDIVSTELRELGILDFISSNRGTIQLGIGDVDVTASREDLEYKARTREKIVSSLKRIHDEFISNLVSQIKENKGGLSNFHLRLKIISLVGDHNLKSFPGMDDWTDHTVKLYTLDSMEWAPGTFKFCSRPKFEGKKLILEETPTFSVDESRTLLIADDMKTLRRVRHFSSLVSLVIPLKGVSIDSVEEELKELLARKNLDGVPIKRVTALSESELNIPQPSAKPSNVKHSEKCFHLVDHPYVGGRTPSENWVSSSRDPHPDDVFLVLERFEPQGFSGNDFAHQLKNDKSLLKNLFDVPFPKVYGLKTTEKDPLDLSKVVGISYHDWRLKVFREGFEKLPDLKVYLECVRVLELGERSLGIIGYNSHRFIQEEVKKNCSELFDKGHPINQFWAERDQTYTTRWNLEKTYPILKDIEARNTFLIFARKEHSETDSSVASNLLKRYPLIRVTGYNNHGIGVFTHRDTAEEFAHYIKCVDKF